MRDGDGLIGRINVRSAILNLRGLQSFEEGGGTAEWLQRAAVEVEHRHCGTRIPLAHLTDPQQPAVQVVRANRAGPGPNNERIAAAGIDGHFAAVLRKN